MQKTKHSWSTYYVTQHTEKQSPFRCTAEFLRSHSYIHICLSCSSVYMFLPSSTQLTSVRCGMKGVYQKLSCGVHSGPHSSNTSPSLHSVKTIIYHIELLGYWTLSIVRIPIN
jgi:hypothetical protein